MRIANMPDGQDVRTDTAFMHSLAHMQGVVVECCAACGLDSFEGFLAVPRSESILQEAFRASELYVRPDAFTARSPASLAVLT